MLEETTTTLEPPAEYEDLKLVALMSVPMCGWNPHWGCVCEAIRPFQIPIRLGYGAFWHQTMQNLIEDCIDDGIDWVLTLDYDSLFSADQLDRLIRRFGSRPDIDALAALQCKRGVDETPLMTIQGVDNVEVNGQPIKVDTAHFGLTLIRLDAVQKMLLPWFVSQPDPRGSYKTLQRTDADIFFWRQWAKNGNTLYVDPQVSIGHLQAVATEFDEHLNVRHTAVTEWRKKNMRQDVKS